MTHGAAPMVALPLLTARDLAQPLAWVGRQPVSAGTFIAEASALAERLPAAGRPINLCRDRYAFALGLAAALLRGQTSLLPPNALPATLTQLPAPAVDGEIDARSPVYALVDDAAGGADTGDLHAVRVGRIAGIAAARSIPLLPARLEAACLLTSGSTGLPQPHAKPWHVLHANIAAQAERLSQLLGWPSLDGLALLATVPAQHSYGFESSLLLALLGGASLCAGRPFYPADVADALAALPEPRALVTTPFHLKTLLRAGVPLPRVQLVLSATAPLTPQLAAQTEQVLRGRLVEIYGCTEAGQVATRRTTAGAVWTTLGALRLRPAEDSPDADAGAGAEGRCVVHGGHVEVPTPLADVLELLDTRHFRLLGRADDLVHVAGKRSSLAHLNFHLNRVPGVQDGAFWLPETPAADEAVVRPVAFVVAPGVPARRIADALRQPLEAAFVPRRVVHVDALPREATGKLTVQALAAFARARLGMTDADADADASADGRSKPAANADADLDADLDADADAAAVFEAPPDHPAFAGHFPGHPVLPGVVLLGWVLRALQARPALHAVLGSPMRIEQVKFLVPIRPGARVHVRLRQQAGGIDFEIAEGATVAARGHLA